MDVRGLLRVVSHPSSSAGYWGAVLGGGGLGGGVALLGRTPVKLLCKAAMRSSNPESGGSCLTVLLPSAPLMTVSLPVKSLMTVQPSALAYVPSLTGIHKGRRAGGGGRWGGAGRSGKGPEAAEAAAGVPEGTVLWPDCSCRCNSCNSCWLSLSPLLLTPNISCTSCRSCSVR